MEHALTTWLLHYGLVGIFITLTLEDMGLPLPTQVVYVVGQALITTKASSFLAVLAVLQAGYLIGSVISYFIGRKLAKPLSKGPAAKAQRKLTLWYGKYGAITVFSTRLIGYIRPWSSYAAGIAEVPVVPFIVLNFLGSLLLNLIALAITSQVAGIWTTHPLLQQAFAAFTIGGFFITGWAVYSQRDTIDLDSPSPSA